MLLLHATRCNNCRLSNMLESLQLLQHVACNNAINSVVNSSFLDTNGLVFGVLSLSMLLVSVQSFILQPVKQSCKP